MALDYDGASAGVFTRIGKILKYINSRNATAVTTWPAELKAIADLFETADLTLQIENLYSTYEGFKQAVVSERETLASFCNNVLLDRDTMLTQLVGSPQANLADVLPALWRQMVLDSKTIDRSTVTLGSTTAASGNTGNGVILATKVLDGFNQPLSEAQSVIEYNTVSSELAVPSETMTLVCDSDNGRDGVTEGEEQFSWTGGLKGSNWDYLAEGSGPGPSIKTVNSSSILTDGAMENWGGSGNNTPSNWTVDNGTAGTHIYRESSTIYRGTYGVKFTGDGAAATIQLGQSVTPSLMPARKRHIVGLRMRCSAVPAAGTFYCNFTGTGYTATSPTHEVQTVQISGTPTGGTYTLSWVGPYGATVTTAAIAYNAAAATVQAAIRLLSGLESVVVALTAGAPPDQTLSFTFYGTVGNINQMTSASSLTGGAPVITHATTTSGVEGEKVNLNAATAFPVANTWTLRYFYINTPAVMPSDWKLVFGCGSTLSNTVNVFVDDVFVDEVKYHGGVGVNAVAGSTRFVVGDRFTFTVVNDQAGVFQELFRRQYKVQMPSSGTPNIADALAQ